MQQADGSDGERGAIGWAVLGGGHGSDGVGGRGCAGEVDYEEEQAESVVSWAWEKGLERSEERDCTHMEKKQSHCMPTWSTPSSPAKQASPLISEQQATSCAVLGKTRILAKAEVPDVVPRRTK